MSQTFKCISCGQCCSHIRGRISKEDKEFLEEYAYGKMPLVQLQPVENISFPLWDFEAKDLKHEKVKPSRIVYDLKTNKAIIVTYYIDSDSCIFLEENRCKEYNKRPSICRFFPFNKGPFSGSSKKDELFGTCPALEKVYDEISDNNLVKDLDKIFPEELRTVAEHDMIMEFVNRTIVTLTKQKKIKPAMNYPYEFLLRRIENSEKINFTEFLIKIGEYTKEEMDEKVKGFRKDAEEKIKRNCN